MALSILLAGHTFLFIQRMKTGQILSQLSLFIKRMSQGFFFYSLSFYSRSPPSPLPHQHWVTVEVINGRGMMPNLTEVKHYLSSLHSPFCFKGFVYIRPITHRLPSHNPTAFKLCTSPGDNM